MLSKSPLSVTDIHGCAGLLANCSRVCQCQRHSSSERRASDCRHRHHPAARTTERCRPVLRRHPWLARCDKHRRVWVLYMWEHSPRASKILSLLTHPLVPCNSLPPLSLTLGGRAFPISAASFNLGQLSAGSTTCVGGVAAVDFDSMCVGLRHDIRSDCVNRHVDSGRCVLGERLHM